MKTRYFSLILVSLFVFTTYVSAQDSDSIRVRFGDRVERNMHVLDLSQLYNRVAYINSNEILDLMPERIKASKELEDLNGKYKAELQVMQNDYNKKYSDFISHQNSMADNIRLRRMQELYELESHITGFMEIAQKDVEEKEKEFIHPLRKKLKEVIDEVGREGSYVCVYDLANPTIIFVTPQGTDISAQVKRKLGIK